MVDINEPLSAMAARSPVPGEARSGVSLQEEIQRAEAGDVIYLDEEYQDQQQQQQQQAQDGVGQSSQSTAHAQRVPRTG